jgi:secretion/DNA translocation related TadE-like protein
MVRRDDGAAAVLAVVLVVGLVSVAMAFTAVVAVWVQRQRLHTVAEVGALAAARLTTQGCEAARALAAVEGVDLHRCIGSGSAVRVVVRRSIDAPWPIRLEAEAVAGQVSPDPG